MAKDYVEFLSDLKGYIGSELIFIKPEESRWKDMPQLAEDERFGHYPVGVLSNGKNTIELFFLHYHSEQEAREKWQRRIKRINWDRMLVKFNDQNGCTEKEGWYTVIHQFPKHDFIMASYEPFGKNKYIDITSVINKL